MAKARRNKGGRPTKDAGPKLSQPDEVERLLVEGEVVPGPDGEAKRVWLTQREVAARFGVSASLIADFAKKRGTTERRARLQAELHVPSHPPSPLESVEAPVTGRSVVRGTYDEGDDDATTEELPKEKRRPGRPRHQDAPVIAWEELDRMLVFGEVQILDDGTTTTVYPTYRALAERYGVVPSVIAEYAKSHNTMKRRKLGEMRIEARRDEKLVELRGDALAFGAAQLSEMIDAFLLKFAEALKEGRVRTDSAADVDRLVRLKEFVQGGPDSRTEVKTILSLESLQERHARMLREVENTTPAMAGVIDARAEVVETEQGKPSGVGGVRLPPGRSVGDGAPEPNLCADLRAAAGDLVSFARELAEMIGADPDDDALVENRVLRAAERVEAMLAAHDGADVGARGAEAEEDEG